MGSIQEAHCGIGEIAVIGLSCRFPGGATNPAKFWDLLAEKKCKSYFFEPTPPKLQDLTFPTKPHIQKLPQVVTAPTVSIIRLTKSTLSVLKVDIF